MAKLGQFTNPVTGNSGSVFNLGQLGSMIFGVVVMLGVFGIGTAIFNAIKRFAPGPLGGALDTRSIFTPNAAPSVVTNAGPSVTLWK